MSLIKLPLLLVGSLCVHRSVTPPNAAPPSGELSKHKDLWPRSYFFWGPGVTKVETLFPYTALSLSLWIAGFDVGCIPR